MALDFLRGTALFGILLLNSTGFGFGWYGKLARHELSMWWRRSGWSSW